jgi:hypothetical protein
MMALAIAAWKTQFCEKAGHTMTLILASLLNSPIGRPELSGQVAYSPDNNDPGMDGRTYILPFAKLQRGPG